MLGCWLLEVGVVIGVVFEPVEGELFVPGKYHGVTGGRFEGPRGEGVRAGISIGTVGLNAGCSCCPCARSGRKGEGPGPGGAGGADGGCSIGSSSLPSGIESSLLSGLSGPGSCM